MDLGSVPADWRHRRLAVRLRPDSDLPFLDAEAPQTHQVLRDLLAPVLAHLGYDDLDVGIVRGPDRRVTRALGHWAWLEADEEGNPRFAGVRYLSRINSEWECWAIFDDVPLEELERRPIPQDMPAMLRVAEMFALTVH